MAGLVGGPHLRSKLRGQLSGLLAKHAPPGDPDPQRTVVRAQLALDSDLPPGPQLCLDAGEHAMRMLDVDLAERFAEAAASADPAAAAQLQAHCILATRGGDEADQFLAGLRPADDAERRVWALMRAVNMIWVLARPAGAEAILAGLAGPQEAQDETRAERAASLSFMTQMSHELRSPLSTILGQTRLLDQSEIWRVDRSSSIIQPRTSWIAC